MLASQRDLFDIPRDVCYLDAAGWSPLPLAVQIRRWIPTRSRARLACGSMRLAVETLADAVNAFLGTTASVATDPGTVLMHLPDGVAFVPPEYHEDPAATRASVERLLELDFSILCFDHGPPILDDPKAVDRREKVERLVLCSGRIYHDMDAAAPRESAENVAVARVELLYPFPGQQIAELIKSYPNLKEVVWTQEEPANMGAWSVMRRRLPDLLPEDVTLEYVGRPERSSPSEGYSVAHIREQERIVLTALTP